MPKQNIMGQIISQSASAQILNVPPSSLPSAWALLDYILWFTFQGWQWRLSHGGVSEIFHSHHTSQTDSWVHLWSLCVSTHLHKQVPLYSQPHYLEITSSNWVIMPCSLPTEKKKCLYSQGNAHVQYKPRLNVETKSNWPQWHVRAMMRSDPL